MPVILTLLDGVRWQGAPVVGDRSQALLAALAAQRGRPIRNERLVELIWGEDAPANAAKALQVVVSRTRAACGGDAIVRDGEGYRLGVAPEQVDSGRLAALVADARRALASDPLGANASARAADRLTAAAPGRLSAPTRASDPLDAAASARAAIALGEALSPVGADEDGPLADVRRAAARDVAAARLVLARATGRGGAHTEALPLLEAAHAAQPDDESLLADLLRSEAAVRGPGAALERFERHRRALRDQLGTNPGDELQQVQRDLLALDNPVRSGVRFDATALLGRDDDVQRLRALLASERVVSIVGPGGLGKTRLAHVLARVAAQPVVHVVELVGVTAPEDLVGEVGSALGVRDSVTGRRALTQQQRADVRSRIAQHLAAAPSLLILDNCEHIVEAVAELVAFLVATTPDLRVLTTTRAPLAIGAEHVYLLDALLPADAVELFRRRAVAARPGVQLDDPLVSNIVERLDRLPLAIELAAAKVRAMSVEEIDRRLEDRFALLRGGDRSAPDRHQTLLAVIDWSWNLLGDGDRRALRRLALFHDGFTLDTAADVLGGDALDALQSLTDQSLLSVRETAGGVRYRMLETVREFGRLQLKHAGEDAEAHAALRAWAAAYARRHGERVFSAEQFDAIDTLGAEEGNLADELREALAEPDPAAAVQLIAGLGSLWSIRGDHVRMLVLTEAISGAVDGWTPPAELADCARAAMGMTLRNAMIALDDNATPVRDLLERLGADGSDDPQLAAMVRVTLAYDPRETATLMPRLEALAASPERHTAQMACHWLSVVRENFGDQDGAAAAAEQALALARPQDGPWLPAILRTQLAQLTAQLGRRDAVAGYARAALPVLERLSAKDDLVQLRALLALCAIADGRLDEAAAEIDLIEQIDEADTLFGGMVTVQVSRAELTLARGEVARGLARYLAAVAKLRALAFPGVSLNGLEPWVLFGEAAALAAFAYHGGPDDEDDARGLLLACRRHGAAALRAEPLEFDYPVTGTILFALGAWGVLREGPPAGDAVRLLVLSERFAYNRTVPTMAWERIEPHAEARAPGAVAAVRAELDGWTQPQLVEHASALLDRLSG
ncbi:BTAD domain-containing putative transcriptional regulator [Conexibacter sp. CPCC 206217]|uniref:BTAD domain-containing putative transcriptional regulator n=1 Tax=Conexibacter sp. CPCC 206217 TaxID=3064574 RepID=UPI002717309D|nr:BTAD domain-containing putative transcriptional regulator [Conexibacter sp. CPCC 206217]MDO8211638.1 BTAD domain-containing putative transcriptional regulator [Conexibacter sp. CPCC 206217]